MSTLPSLYEYYAAGNITSGLSYGDHNQFQLNGKPITLYSGSMHYFRVPPDNWQTSLRKIRSSGLNAIETYIPWNLHELTENQYDFGDGSTDMSAFLQLEKFLKLVKQEDLFLIVRPGPYICTEWDFGGLPSWLLKKDHVRVRTSEPTFMSSVEKYFKVLFTILTMFQFTKGGGPIIAYQVENEYGSVHPNEIDKPYLVELRDLMLKLGTVELLLTSDGPEQGKRIGPIPRVLQTVNFGGNSKVNLDILKGYQPDKPFMVMEYWIGWFDHWGDRQKHKVPTDAVLSNLVEILDYNSSVNFYMFYGGTNWGFMNGANIDSGGYIPDTTSYDYDSPISESGNYTEKYTEIRKCVTQYNRIKTKLPTRSQIYSLKSYEPLEVDSNLELFSVINQASLDTKFRNVKLNSMEYFDQNFGYITYRKTGLTIPKGSKLQIYGRVHDAVLVLINGQLINDSPLKDVDDFKQFGYWKVKDSILNFQNDNDYINATLDLIVENWGRNNFGTLSQFNQKKGLWEGDVYLNSLKIHKWDIVNLPFDKKFQKSYLNSFSSTVLEKKTPFFYKFLLNIAEKDEIGDTFIDMRNWNKGFVIVNNFVLGRHCILGPQQSLFLPKFFLKKGVNEIIIFDHFERSSIELRFSSNPIFNN